MANQKIKLANFILFLVSLFIILGCGNEDSETQSSFTITLDISNLTVSSVELSIKANFNGTAPLWKDGHYYDDVNFQSGRLSIYIDHDIQSGTEYCYQVGGYVILLGDVWSNVVCNIPT